MTRTQALNRALSPGHRPARGSGLPGPLASLFRTAIAGGALFCGAFALPSAVEAEETARGHVFVDDNANGVRDDGETGVAGVAVSNGRDVTRTDGSGAYAITVRPRDFVFVTKPSGYALPYTADHLPRFFYLHDPEGTPAELGLRYRGVAATGPLPERIDFPLRKAEEPDRFEVLLFADTQPQTFKELEFIRDDVIAPLIGTSAAFGITAGDILFDDLSMGPRLNRLIGRIGIPWHNVAGNHELNFQSPDDTYSLESFRRIYGPANYSFSYAKAHFVILDNVFYLGRGKGREEPHPRGAGAYEGRLTEDQLAWLRRDLALVPNDRLVVLVMHIPLSHPLDPERRDVNLLNRKDLFAILKTRDHVMSFAGHTHTNDMTEFGEEDGFAPDNPLLHHTLVTVSGSWWSGPKDMRGIPATLQSDGVPNGHSVLTVDGNRAEVRYVPANLPADTQMRITFDSQFHRVSPNGQRDYGPGALQGSPITTEQVYATDVVVNLFNGGPRSKVSMRLDEGEPIAMVRTRMPDPTSAEMIARHKADYKSWVRARPSTHIWTARLPADLGPGLYTVTVEAVDTYGLEHTGHRILEVLGYE